MSEYKVKQNQIIHNYEAYFKGRKMMTIEKGVMKIMAKIEQP